MGRARYQCPNCAAGEPHAFKHGVSGYSNHHCRCDTCVDACNAARRAQYARRADHYRAVKRAREERNPGDAAARVHRSYIKHRQRRLAAAADYRERNKGAMRAYELARSQLPEVKQARAEAYQRDKPYEQKQRQRRDAKRDAAIPVTRRYKPWTPIEDLTILRGDISLTEMAFLLGRSYAAVQVRRSNLRRQRAA